MSGKRLVVYDGAAALAMAAADIFVESFHAALREKGFFTAVLSGGGTPLELYMLLASPEYSGKIDWASTHLLWGDERCVPPEDDQSNFESAWEALVSKVDIPRQNIHRIKGELPPQQAASEYEGEIRSLLGIAPDELPSFDLVLLGLGADGHTLSIFPDTDAHRNPHGLVMANYVPKLKAWRVTMTPDAISLARKTLFLAAGSAKALALKGMLKGDYPAGAVTGEDVLVFADNEAAEFNEE